MASFLVTDPDGTPTIWMPLTTTFSAPGSCSSLFFQQNLYDTAGSTAVSWVLGYVIPALLPSSAVCLPSAAIVSHIAYTNAENGVPQTPISIGPMDCPDAWSVVHSTTNSNGLHIMCCPTAYDRYTGDDSSGGCITYLTSGQVLTYGSTMRGSSSIVVTTTTMTFGSTIFADPIQGYSTLAPGIAAALPPQPTTSGSLAPSSSITTPATETQAGASSSPSSSTATLSTTAHQHSELSSGAKAGIGVGVAIAACAFVVAIVMASLSARRRRKKRQAMMPAKAAEMRSGHERDGGGGGGDDPRYTPLPRAEMHDTALYELGDDRGAAKTVIVSELEDNRR